jgi:glycerate 2-kinase
MPMRILIAPDKFKGSLTAVDAAQAIARGIAAVRADAEAVLMPIADGGEGTAGAICAALGGRWITVPACDPLRRPVEARYAWLENDVAVIDMSEASGLWRLSRDEYDPLNASTFGTGQLVADAMRRGARKILVGLGGSATNDGGVGLAEALGFEFLGRDGKRLRNVPADLADLDRIVAPDAHASTVIIGLCDVQNPLLGERGASRTYGPQKGADPGAVARLDRNLARLADVVARDLRCDFRETPGAGAAGGLGFGLLGFCGAELRSGFETLAEVLGLEREIAASDWIITGEGRLDAQTLEGKGPAGVAALARKHHRPVIAFAGAVADDPRIVAGFDHVFAITPAGMPPADAFREAARLLTNGAADAAAGLFGAGGLRASIRKGDTR